MFELFIKGDKYPRTEGAIIRNNDEEYLSKELPAN